MNDYPPSAVHLGDLAAVIYGPHFHIFHSVSGALVASTTQLESEAISDLSSSGPIRCSALDGTQTHIVTSADDKVLKVWRIQPLELLSKRESPKKPTSIVFTSDGQTILVSDKFGDVFSYPLHPEPINESPKTDKALASHDNPSGGRLVLGHVSLLTSLVLSPDEQYLITADRDEHIRVSWYPQGYNIECYCLGHTKFVSSIHILSSDKSKLISGGGDENLKVWDWINGKLLQDIPIWDSVQPFVAIKPPKRKRWVDEPGEEGVQDTGKRARRRRKRAAAKANANVGDVVMDDGEGTPEPVDPNVPEATQTLVIHKIDSIGSLIVFSAVGTTAIFAARYPNGPVIHFDLGVPVIDYAVSSHQQLWVAVDGNGSKQGSRQIRVLRINETDHLEEMVELDSLATATNSDEYRVKASAEDLKTLDLYHDLASMPKNSEVEHDPMEQPVDQDVSKRQQGRLKRKGQLAAMVEGRSTKEEEEVATKRVKNDPE